MSTKFDPKAAAQRFISAVNSVGPEEADSSAVEAPKRGRKKETSEQKKIQTTIYFYEEELVRIEEQTGRGKRRKINLRWFGQRLIWFWTFLTWNIVA